MSYRTENYLRFLVAQLNFRECGENRDISVEYTLYPMVNQFYSVAFVYNANVACLNSDQRTDGRYNVHYASDECGGNAIMHHLFSSM